MKWPSRAKRRKRRRRARAWLGAVAGPSHREQSLGIDVLRWQPAAEELLGGSGGPPGREGHVGLQGSPHPNHRQEVQLQEGCCKSTSAANALRLLPGL